MKKKTGFNICFVFHISGTSNIPEHLQAQVETFLEDSVVPMLEMLKNKVETLEVTMAVIDCDDAKDVVIHKCLEKIRFKKNIRI